MKNREYDRAAATIHEEMSPVKWNSTPLSYRRRLRAAVGKVFRLEKHGGKQRPAATPQRFRNLPVIREAMQFDGTPNSASDIIDWLASFGATAEFFCEDDASCDAGDHVLKIRTLEGEMDAAAGAWVMRGVRDEAYPVQDAILRASYEPVEEGE